MDYNTYMFCQNAACLIQNGVKTERAEEVLKAIGDFLGKQSQNVSNRDIILATIEASLRNIDKLNENTSVKEKHTLKTFTKSRVGEQNPNYNKRVTPEKVAELRKRGYTYDKIASALMISKPTVVKRLREYEMKRQGV